MKFRATYEDGTNTVLREAVADNLPDVTMQGLNRQAILVEKGIAKSLEPFIAKEADFEKDGYHQAMLDLGTFNDEVYGPPFSVSLRVGYNNLVSPPTVTSISRDGSKASQRDTILLCRRAPRRAPTARCRGRARLPRGPAGKNSTVTSLRLKPAGQQGQGRIMAQVVVVTDIFMTKRHADDPLSDQAGQALDHTLGRTVINETLSNATDQFDRPVNMAAQ